MPRIIVKSGGKEFVYDKAEEVTTIGRHSGNHLCISDPTVSESHCRIEKVRGTYLLLDLGGKNGTYVNGVRVERHVLKAGDTIQIGATTLIFKGAPTQTGGPWPTTKPLLISGQEDRFVLDVVTGKDAGRRFPLRAEKTTIGRGSECALRLSDPTASRLHALVTCTPTEFLIEDLNTRNGTEVNGKRISLRCPLKHGDEIRVGHTRIVFRDLASLAHRVETVALSPSTQEQPPSLTPAEESVVLDGRHFLQKVTARQKMRRRVKAVVGIVLLIALCGSGYWAAKKYGLIGGKTGFVTVNLLTINPNFEAGLVDNLPKGWSFGAVGQSRWHAAKLPTGGICLDLEGAPDLDSATPAEAVCQERLKVHPGKQYQVSARVRSESPKGVAFLKVKWLRGDTDPKTLLESYSQPVWGVKDWHWLTAVFEPPSLATEFQVACVGVANVASFFFDDLIVYEGPASPTSPGIIRVDVGNHTLHMDAKGLFCVSEGDTLLITQGEGCLEGNPGPRMRQAFSSIESGYPDSRTSGWANFSNWMVDTNTMTLVNLRQTTNPVVGGHLMLTYTIIGDKEQTRPIKWVGTSFRLPAEVVQAGIEVGSGVETFIQTGEFKQTNVNSLVIGKGEKRLVIDFSTPYMFPFTLECKKDGAEYHALLMMPLDQIQPMQRVEWSLTFGRLSTKRGKDAILQARQAIFDGDKVAALNIYQKILNSDLISEADKQVAQMEIKEIEDAIAKAILPVKEEIEKAISKADQDELRVAEIDLKELRDKYGTTRFASQLAALQQQIDDFRQGKIIKASEDIVTLLKKAQANFEKEGWLVAKVFAENVIRKGGPNTAEAKEAQKILDAIPKARDAAKVRDEWIDKQLTRANTFEKNNMFDKAIPIYEEILQKYPKFPRRPDIEKKLNEAKKKTNK